MRHPPTRRALRRLFPALFIFTLFRRGTPPRDEDEGEGLALLDEEDGPELGGIRCPRCKWRPRSSSLWYCGDCWEPERFLEGCGTEWNTFHTRGRCPGCMHQWRWTSCLSCEEWSLHEDWYESQDGSRFQF
jgi:hypothetical protein